MSDIFRDAALIRTGYPKNVTYAWIKVGNDPANKYAIINKADGVQIFRTQYDVAVDGTRYMLTAGRGRGGFSFTVLEGPMYNCDGSDTATFASNYGNLDKYSQRTVDVVLSLTPGKQAAKNTKNAAHFSGVIVTAQTSQGIDEEAQVFTQTLISAEGMWR